MHSVCMWTTNIQLVRIQSVRPSMLQSFFSAYDVNSNNIMVQHVALVWKECRIYVHYLLWGHTMLPMDGQHRRLENIVHDGCSNTGEMKRVVGGGIWSNVGVTTGEHNGIFPDTLPDLWTSGLVWTEPGVWFSCLWHRLSIWEDKNEKVHELSNMFKCLFNKRAPEELCG